MNSTFKLAVILGAAALGLLVGKFFRPGATAHPLATSSGAASAGLNQPAARSKPSNSTPAIDDSPLATKLERNLLMSKGITHWLYWFEALEKSSPSDFPRLARLARDSRAATRMVAARWAEVAPRHLFDTLVGASGGSSELPIPELWKALVKEWTKHDPEAMIAALNEPGDLGVRGEWKRTVADAIFNQDVERGLLLFGEWHIENYGPSMKAVAKWADADPLHAAQFALQNRAGYATELCIKTIGKHWAKSDPSAALAFAVSEPGGFETTLAGSVLNAWVQTDLGAATAWLTNADTATRERLSPAFAEAWAKTDASNALAWCQEELTGSSLVKAVGAVLKGAAGNGGSAAATLVAAMEASAARTQAAVQVAKQWFPELSSDKQVTPAMVAWLGGLDPVALKRVMEEVQWGWSTSDPKSMSAFLANSSSEAIPDNAYSLLARELAHKDPAQALDWADHLLGERAISAGSAVYAEWWGSQPEAANQWLSALPASDPRREAFFQSAVKALVWKPQAAQQIAAMSPSDRAAVRPVIEAMTDLAPEKRGPLLEALGAPEAR